MLFTVFSGFINFKGGRGNKVFFSFTERSCDRYYEGRRILRGGDGYYEGRDRRV